MRINNMERKVIRIAATLGVLIVCASLGQNCDAQAQPAPTRMNFDVQGVGALDALIRLGELYDQPMGIICRDAEIATHSITLTLGDVSAQDAMQALMHRLPGYKWRKDNGVFLVQPEVLAPQTETMLKIVLPRIFVEKIDVDALSWRLWMELQVRVDSEARSRGFLMVGNTQNYYELGKVDLTNVRIDQVLNEIVRRKKSAAWVMLPPPEALKGASRDRLWGIVTYKQPPQPLDQLCCVKLDLR
jgi:hypothetical protein